MTHPTVHILDAADKNPPHVDVAELVRAAQALDRMIVAGGGFVCPAGLRDLVEEKIQTSIDWCEDNFVPGIGLMEQIYEQYAPNFHLIMKAQRRQTQKADNIVNKGIDALKKIERSAA